VYKEDAAANQLVPCQFSQKPTKRPVESPDAWFSAIGAARCRATSPPSAPEASDDPVEDEPEDASLLWTADILVVFAPLAVRAYRRQA